jgi:hypothetical protein
VAHEAGHACDHVNYLGLGGSQDRHLMAKIHTGDYTFVTNNRADFLGLYAKEQLHCGLVIILPNVAPARQRELFEAALIDIGKRDLINAVLEVELAGTMAICREYRYPPR